MNVNDHFNDFPIDYFSLEIENFIEVRGFENSSLANTYLQNSLDLITKETLLLNDEGYISESLSEKLNLDTKNTSVINCAVGQGKTSSILKIIAEHLSLRENYDDKKIIIAVPLLSLISQYKTDLLELGFTESEIFSYERIRSEDQDDYLNNDIKIHLITVNCLLGNPGENSAIQNDAKNKYLRKLSKNFEENNKKVIFIYDEIHEAIGNFSKIGEAHLYYFSKVILKNILLSATYNIQSIPVVKMLSKLTDGKVQILESERRIIREQSRLHLHFRRFYAPERYGAVAIIIKDLVEEGKNIDILCYSKKLCKKLLDTNHPTGRILTERFGPLRDCTANCESNQSSTDSETPSNRFDNNFCNIGTNFKSGVSITKENHAFLIVLPPNSKDKFSSSNGIFSEGINSIIQAVARQRLVGDIHIIMPPPIWMNSDSLIGMSNEQRNIFTTAFNNIGINPSTARISRDNSLVNYIPFSQHYNIILEKYAAQIIRLLEPFNNNAHLQIPDIFEYIMEKGEMILTTKRFLGKNLSSFVTYSAFTNQFYNARLYNYNIPIITTDESFRDFLHNAYESYMEESENQSKQPSVQYNDLYNTILSGVPPSLSDNDVKKLKEKIFLHICQNLEAQKTNSNNLNIRYLIKEYNLLDNSSNSSDITRKLKYYINKVRNSARSNDKEVKYFLSYDEQKIFDGEREDLLNLINQIREENPALKLSGAKFFRDSNIDNIAEKFYDYVIKSLYSTKRYRPRIGAIQNNNLQVIQDFLRQNL